MTNRDYEKLLDSLQNLRRSDTKYFGSITNRFLLNSSSNFQSPGNTVIFYSENREGRPLVFFCIMSNFSPFVDSLLCRVKFQTDKRLGNTTLLSSVSSVDKTFLLIGVRTLPTSQRQCVTPVPSSQIYIQCIPPVLSSDSHRYVVKSMTG